MNSKEPVNSITPRSVWFREWCIRWSFNMWLHINHFLLSLDSIFPTSSQSGTRRLHSTACCLSCLRSLHVGVQEMYRYRSSGIHCDQLSNQQLDSTIDLESIMIGGDRYRYSQYSSVDGSQATTRDVSNPVNNGINYQPQLVSNISEPSTVC